MRVSFKWLRDYVDIKLPPEEIAGRLTMAGNEVGKVEFIGENWEDIVIGEIKAVKRHPGADKLRLVAVNTGREELTVVSGAPNLYIGDKIAFAYVGARLFDGHTGEPFRLKASKIRGVISAGMCCSEKELGLSQKHEEILILPKDAPLGTKLADYLGDVILDIEVTPNRPDCLSVLGIAREVAALTGETVRVPQVSYPESEIPIRDKVKVVITAPDLAPRYSASLISGVRVGESPGWLKERLLAAGMRPLNNIVDATNYVMLEYGQPLHAFDFSKIAGSEIIVRRAKQGETIVSIDEAERKLGPEMLVIADREKAVAIAGVMGGLTSEVTPGTSNVLLESANFKAPNVHAAARTLNLSSEASHRFERGISPELTVPALRRATQLISEIAHGRAARDIIDNYPGKREPERITLGMKRAKTILGVELTLDQVTATLGSLGFTCEPDEATPAVTVTPPYWRSDVRIPEDLVEEVARIMGYDSIPLTLMAQALPPQNPEKGFYFKRAVRQNLTGQGFQEIISFSLTNEDMLRRVMLDLPPLRLVNPMTEEQSCLRTTLRVGLLAALSANRRFEEGGIRLFEIGKVYLPRRGELPEEPEMLGGILAGLNFSRSWHGGDGGVDFYDAKGAVQELLDGLQVSASFATSPDKGLALGKQAAIITKGNEIGVIGEVQPKVTAAFEIFGPVYLFEINLTKLLPTITGERLYRMLPRFPAVVRDVALIIDEGISHEQVYRVITGFSLVSGVTLFDVYSGEPIPPGKKSLAYSITFQAPDRTLTDEEMSGVLAKILRRLSGELGATLRG